MNNEPKKIVIDYVYNSILRTSELDPKDIACRDRNNNFDMHRTLGLIADCYTDIRSIYFRY